MERSQRLRQQNRRILAWSLGVAAVAHVAVLLLVSWDRPTHVFARDTEIVEIGEAAMSGLPVRAFFSPPRITVTADSLWREPPGRVLSSELAVALPPGCDLEDLGPSAVARGVVRLRVSDTGHAEPVEVAQSSGNYCWDGMLGKVAGSLLYRWLPSDEHPAPVDVYQPLTVTLVE